MGALTVEVTDDQLADLLSFSAVFTVTEDAVQNLTAVEFSDEEIEVFTLVPEAMRMKISARLVELAEDMRETLRELDGRILQLTGRA